jgi:hypothetical protein
MRSLTTDVLKEFLAASEPPCISLYQPTHRSNPDNLQDSIRYKNLVRDAERSLLEKFPDREVRPMLERFHALVDKYQFWTHQRDGLAVLAAGDKFEVFQLQRPVKELVVVADTFHLKPLLRMVQSADRFQVLCLDRHKASLYEGNRDALDEVDLGDMPATITEALGSELTEQHLTVGSYGAGAARAAGGGAAPAVHAHGDKADEVNVDRDRFFRVIDREVLARYSRPSGLPLVLAALTEHHAEFRRVSHNPFLQANGVMKNPGSLSADQLRTEVWKVIEPIYLARLAKLTEDHQTAAARGQAASDLNEVAKAAVAARIGILLIEADREIPGRFDPATGDIQLDRLADPEVDDLIDDVAEAVLRGGGEVIVVPTERMPTDTGLAATFRY